MYVALGWWLIAAGFVVGAVFGVLAQNERWSGGYASRSRRLMRLGHVALIALGTLNVAWPLTTTAQVAPPSAAVITHCFALGGLMMGPVCFIAAYCWSCRCLFVIPATA